MISDLRVMTFKSDFTEPMDPLGSRWILKILKFSKFFLIKNNLFPNLFLLVL